MDLSIAHLEVKAYRVQQCHCLSTAGGTLLGSKTGFPSPKPGMTPPWSVPSLWPHCITQDELCSLCLKNAVQFGLDDGI